MSFALIGLISIAVCWKWGDWRRWERYYPTILYLLIGDLVSDYLLYGNSLWAFGSFVEKFPVLDICITLLLYPTTVILYLSFYPGGLMKQALYVLMWAGIYTLAEWIACHTGGFCYHDGWNIWYSLIFNMLMFPLLRLHFKKPLLVWPISAALCFLFLWWFRIPLMRL
jgi:hypothetical protein